MYGKEKKHKQCAGWPGGNHPEHPSARLRMLFASRVLAASAARESKHILKLSKKQKTEIRSILEVEGERIRLLASQLTKNSRQLHLAASGKLTDANQLQPLLGQRRQIEAELQTIKELLMSRISGPLRSYYDRQGTGSSPHSAH
jgi:hypothetical protein